MTDSIAGKISSVAQLYPKKIALISEHVCLTYEELVRAGHRYADHLRSMGAHDGARICSIVGNRPETLVALLAADILGADFSPLDCSLPPGTIRSMLCQLQADIVIANDTLCESLKTDDPTCYVLLPVPQLEDIPSACGDLSNSHASRNRSNLIITSSGTTGKPKHVFLSSGSIVKTAETFRQLLNLTPVDVCLCALPLSYFFGIVSASYTALLNGCTLVILSKFHPRVFLDALKRYYVTYTVGVPSLYALIVNYMDEKSIQAASHRLNRALVSGAPVSDLVIRKFREKFSIGLTNYYGLTECAPVFFGAEMHIDADSSCVGPVVPDVEIRLLDKEGQPARVGEVGELLVKSPRMLDGYLIDNSTNFPSSDGWFRTGDLAVEGADGTYQIIGRTSDIIISAGYNVAPAEVERTIQRVPGVLATVVVGVPDPILGEKIVAFVARENGATVTGHGVQEFLKTALPAYKVPHEIKLVERIPYTAAGKFDKAALRGSI